MVDETSEMICRDSVYFQGAQKDFLTRQKTFEMARQKRSDLRVQHEEAQYTFQPSISDQSRRLVCENVNYIETPEDRIQRLAVKDVERRSQLRSTLQQHHLEQSCPFRPEVSKTTTATTSTPACDDDPMPGLPLTAHERLYRHSVDYRSRGCCSNALGDGSRSEEQLTFRPELDPRHSRRYAHVKAHYCCAEGEELMKTIAQDLERRAERAAEARQKEALKLQQECTFRPMIFSSTPGRAVKARFGETVGVPGLDRFLELKNMAKQQQQELRTREAKVFRDEASNHSRNVVTVPEPFNLSSTPVASKAPPLGGIGHTFAPQTLESANRAYVRSLLMEKSPRRPQTGHHVAHLGKCIEFDC